MKSKAAEVEFICIVQQRIDSNEYIQISEIHKLYKDIINKYDLSDTLCLTRLQLKRKLKANVKNISITNPKRTSMSLVHSCDSTASANRVAVSSQSNTGKFEDIVSKWENYQKFNKKKRQPWSFSGSVGGLLSAGVPEELLALMRWIIQGTLEASTGFRKQEVERSCALLSQYLITFSVCHLILEYTITT